MRRQERDLWIGLAILSSFLIVFCVGTVSASGESIDPVTSAGSGVPRITANPVSLDFGPVKMGATSPEKTIKVTNGGAGDLMITGLAIAGSQASEFHQTNDCGTIAAGGSCTIRAVFAPALPFGPKSAKVRIISNDPVKPVLNVPMTGKSPRPKISVSPAPPAILNLGPVGVGKTSLPKTITVRNNGISDLVVSGITITGLNGSEFGQTPDCTTVPAGGSCTLNVTLTPSLPYGYKEATVRIFSNDPVTPTARAKIAGKAQPPKISVTPSPLEPLRFGSVEVGNTSLPATVTVSNIGLSDLVVNSISVTGVNDSEFNQTNDCLTILAQASCTINATFSPTSPGLKNASINISSNDPAKPTVTFKLKGNGMPGTEVGVWDVSTWDDPEWGL